MFSAKIIDQNPDYFLKGWILRGKTDKETHELIQTIRDLYEQKCILQHENDQKRQQLKKISETMKPIALDLSTSLSREDFLKHAKDLKKDIEINNKKFLDVDLKLTHILETVPNIPWEDVPKINSEIVTTFREPLQTSWHMTHDVIAKKWNCLHEDRGARVSGSRFVFLSGILSKLERALAQWLLDEHEKKGYLEVSPPYLVKSHAMYGTGNLPKFHEDAFSTQNDLWLIPTSEVALSNWFCDEVIELNDSFSLPLRMTACTPCFRSEAGSSGRDMKGLIRLHQFMKIELVHFCLLEDSRTEHEFMRRYVEHIMETLELPYQTIILPGHDFSFSAHKTYDIEVWLPGQKTYREISSISACGDFQCRRMKTRFRDASGKIVFGATLNGSALPLGRLLVALLENGQCSDGSVKLPVPLHAYIQGTYINSEGMLCL